MSPTPSPPLLPHVGVMCVSVACCVPQASMGRLLSAPGGARGWAPSCGVPARLRERGSGCAMGRSAS